MEDLTMYEQEKQQCLVDAFTRYYEIATEFIYDEYLKRADGIIDCPFDKLKGIDSADSYHTRLEQKLDKLAELARDLRITIFDTTKH
jgi:hypothetical protein